METGILFLGSGVIVWFLTYITNRLWLGWNSIIG